MEDDEPELGLGGPLETAFLVFHHNHPEVYKHLVRYARWLKKHGATQSTIAFCFEAIRGKLPLEKDGCGVELNNNHRAFYSRYIMKKLPEFKGFFRLRKQKIQSTFGPDNDDLESGEHRF